MSLWALQISTAHSSFILHYYLDATVSSRHGYHGSWNMVCASERPKPRGVVEYVHASASQSGSDCEFRARNAT